MNAASDHAPVAGQEVRDAVLSARERTAEPKILAHPDAATNFAIGYRDVCSPEGHRPGENMLLTVSIKVPSRSNKMAGVVDLRCVVIVFRRPIPAPWVTMFSCGLPRRTVAQARQNLCPVESYYFFLIALSGTNVDACGSAFEQLRKNLYMDLRVSSYGPPFHYLINGYFFSARS